MYVYSKSNEFLAKKYKENKIDQDIDWFENVDEEYSEEIENLAALEANLGLWLEEQKDNK